MFDSCLELAWIGTSRMKGKVFEGGKGEISGYSTEEGGKLSVQDIYQKIRNHVYVCLCSLTR